MSPENTEKTGKRRLAFIDQCVKEADVNTLMDRNRWSINKGILSELEKFCTITPYRQLDENTYAKLRRDVSVSGQYDLIVTHAPSDKFYITMVQYYERQCSHNLKEKPELAKMLGEMVSSNLYGKSVEIIGKMHRDFPETRIMVVTGANESFLPDKKLKEAGASWIIRRFGINYPEGTGLQIADILSGKQKYKW